MSSWEKVFRLSWYSRSRERRKVNLALGLAGDSIRSAVFIFSMWDFVAPTDDGEVFRGARGIWEVSDVHRGGGQGGPWKDREISVKDGAFIFGIGMGALGGG